MLPYMFGYTIQRCSRNWKGNEDEGIYDKPFFYKQFAIYNLQSDKRVILLRKHPLTFLLQNIDFEDVANTEVMFCGVFFRRHYCFTGDLLTHFCNVFFNGCILFCCNPLNFVLYEWFFQSGLKRLIADVPRGTMMS